MQLHLQTLVKKNSYLCESSVESTHKNGECSHFMNEWERNEVTHSSCIRQTSRQHLLVN